MIQEIIPKIFEENFLSDNNKVFVRGWVDNDLEYNHTYKGIDFYCGFIRIPRFSETMDTIPIIAPGNLKLKKGTYEIFAELRTYNKKCESKSKLIIKLFVKAYKEINEEDCYIENNIIFFEGTICKPIIFRITSKSINISDVCLAVNTNSRRAEYIPCIFWKKCAKEVSKLKIGDEIQFYGRIQSREYKKQLEDKIENQVAYEVSCMSYKKL